MHKKILPVLTQHVFFDVSLNELLNKQSGWFETPWPSYDRQWKVSWVYQQIYRVISGPPYIPQALEIRKEDQSCLVARSRCYLQLGDTDNALKDAETSLADDTTFHKVSIAHGIVQSSTVITRCKKHDKNTSTTVTEAGN